MTRVDTDLWFGCKLPMDVKSSLTYFDPALARRLETVDTDMSALLVGLNPRSTVRIILTETRTLST